VKSADAATPETKGKGRLKREATEAALIDAFGRVVQRSGLRNVGVNEVIKEAGIGKALLYHYFGGLPGLVKAWGEKNQIWPDLSEFRDMPEGQGAAELIKSMVLHHARSLRDDPLRVEILAEQFMNPTPISEALQEIRQQLGQEHQLIFQENEDIQRYRALMMFLMSAASFLAMRSVKAPWYMGENLATDKSWDLMMDQLRQVIDATVT
jgi:AcrR family transcriptional regulator